MPEIRNFGIDDDLEIRERDLGSQTEYTVSGPVALVAEAVLALIKSYPPAGYATGVFDRATVKVTRHNSCD